MQDYVTNFEFSTLFVELHILCILILGILLWKMSHKKRGEAREISIYLRLVYACCFLTLSSDATWCVIEKSGWQFYPVQFLINAGYFIGTTFGMYFWLLFCLKSLKSRFFKYTALKCVMAIPAATIIVLLIGTYFAGWLFTFENGQYVRGPFIALDVLIKYLYFALALIFTIVSCVKEKDKQILKKKILLYSFDVPVVFSGIFQVVSGFDANCIGFTMGLLLLYITGIYNFDSEKGEIFYSFSNTFDATFYVNMHDNTIKTLRVKNEYNRSIKRINYEDNYEKRIEFGLKNNVMESDRKTIEDAFNINNIMQRFNKESMYSIIYRLKNKDGNPIYHQATFMKTEGSSGRDGFIICIQNIEDDKIEKIVMDRTAEITEKNQRLEALNEKIIEAMAGVLEARDLSSGQHIQRVKYYTERIAKQIMFDHPEYGLTLEKIQHISKASVLHDIGKISIPDSILLKPGKLTSEEFEVMKTHTTLGCDVLDKIHLELNQDYNTYAREIMKYHHEKYDGKGYPEGLVGDKIPISAQIVSVADCYDALAHKRVYKDAVPHEKAVQMILNGECGTFSEVLKEAFTLASEDFPYIEKDLEEETKN